MNKRLLNLDLSKLIGILFITFFHIMTIQNPIGKWGSLFKITIFFIVAGFLFSKKDNNIISFNQYIKGLFKSLIVPYLIFSFLSICLDIAVNFSHIENVGELVTTDILMTITFRGMSTLWFLPVLFCVKLLLFLISKLKKKYLFISLSLLISLIFGIITQIYIIKYIDFSSNEFYIYLLNFIFKSLISYFFIGVGYFFEKFVRNFFKKNILFFVISVLLLIVSIFISIPEYSIDYNNVILGSSKCYLFYFGSVISSLSIITLFMFVPDFKYSRYIAYFGVNSLLLMVIQAPLKLIAVCSKIIDRIIDYDYSLNYLYIIRCSLVFVLVLLLSIVIIEIVNRFFPWILGKKSITNKNESSNISVNNEIDISDGTLEFNEKSTCLSTTNDYSYYSSDNNVEINENSYNSKTNDFYVKNEKQKEIKKSLSKNSLYYLIYTTLNMIFPLLTGIYVTRVLLPSDIGQVEKAINLVQYFVILSFLGIPTYGLREISKVRDDKKELSKVYSELRIINNISTLIFGSIFLIVVFSVPSYRENYNVFLIVGILIALNLLNNSWLYEGLEEFGYISIRNLVFKILSFILLVVFVRKESDYYIYAFIYCFGTAGNYFLNIINSRKYVKFSFKDLNIKRHIKPIMFLVAVNLAIEVYMLVDVTMLGFMCDEETVAFYSYGMKVYKILLQIINTFTIVLVPRIALYYKENRKYEMNKLISRTFVIIFLLALPMAAGVFFTSDYLVCLIYGSSYIRSAQVLKVLCFICCISPIGYLLGSRMLLITGNESKMIIAVGVGAIVNVICNLILIHFFSEIGAAFASLFSETIVMIIYVFLGKKYFKLSNVIGSCLKILVSTLVLILFCIIINNIVVNNDLLKTIIQILGSILLYFLTLFLLREKYFIDILRNIKERFVQKY